MRRVVPGREIEGAIAEGGSVDTYTMQAFYIGGLRSQVRERLSKRDVAIALFEPFRELETLWEHVLGGTSDAVEATSDAGR
jgi:hypothetical protein